MPMTLNCQFEIGSVSGFCKLNVSCNRECDVHQLYISDVEVDVSSYGIQSPEIDLPHQCVVNILNTLRIEETLLENRAVIRGQW